MESATEVRIRACLIREGVCGEEPANRVAAVIAEEIAAGDEARVSHDQFEARLAQLDARIAQLGRDFAERDARLARQMTEFIAEMQELERQRDERERQRDERERQRDERERQRDTKADERYEQFRRVVYWGFGISSTGIGILIALLALLG